MKSVLSLFILFYACADKSNIDSLEPVSYDCYAYSPFDQSLTALATICYDQDCIKQFKELAEKRFHIVNCVEKFN